MQDFYEDGQLKTSITYNDNMKDGPYEEYFQNGQMKLFGYFKKDRRDGTFEVYSEDGELQQKIVYESGRVVQD